MKGDQTVHKGKTRFNVSLFIVIKSFFCIRINPLCANYFKCNWAVF